MVISGKLRVISNSIPLSVELWDLMNMLTLAKIRQQSTTVGEVHQNLRCIYNLTIFAPKTTMGKLAEFPRIDFVRT